MHVYRLSRIHLHHCHSEDRVFLNDRIARQVCLSRWMMVYRMRLVVKILRREIKNRGMVVVGYEHDPYHYVISRVELTDYPVPTERNEWYHLVCGFL